MYERKSITEVRPIIERYSYVPGNNHLEKYEIDLPRFLIDDSLCYKLYKEALHEEERLKEAGSLTEKTMRKLIKLYEKAYKAGSSDACSCILYYNAKLALEYGSIEDEDTVLRIFYDNLATENINIEYYYAIYKILGLITENISYSQDAGFEYLKKLADKDVVFAKSFFESVEPRDDLTPIEREIYEDAIATYNVNDKEEW